MSLHGSLQGIRIVEIASIGPGPFCGMMLADHGAEVIRIERPGGAHAGLDLDPAKDVLLRSRRSIAVNLKSPDGVAIVRSIVRTADGLIEGFRPGVMERLGLGPDVLLADNPKLVYGRMTGWGQTGPYAAYAGHDINYIALAGALHAFGRAGEKPTPPINMVGDFGGGGLLLAFGMLAAIIAARTSGKGQIVDCAMTEGASLLMSMVWSLRAAGMWNDARGTNALDTGAHFYDSYETADGRYISVGAIEPKFYADLCRLVGCADDPEFADQFDAARWPRLKEKIAAIFRTKTRDEWCAILESGDVCFAPVLDFDEVADHPHNRAREAFVTAGGVLQPAPAPRLSLTPARNPAMADGADDTDALLDELGIGAAERGRLRRAGVIGPASDISNTCAAE